MVQLETEDIKMCPLLTTINGHPIIAHASSKADPLNFDTILAIWRFNPDRTPSEYVVWEAKKDRSTGYFSGYYTKDLGLAALSFKGRTIG